MVSTHVMLEEGAVATSDYVTFGAAFPGRFVAGEPVALADLGLTESEAAAMIEQAGLPLSLRRVERVPSESSTRRRPARREPAEPAETEPAANEEADDE